MTKLVLLTAVMTVIVFGTASAFKVAVPDTLTAAEPSPAAISIDELHGHANMRSLPEFDIRELY